MTWLRLEAAFFQNPTVMRAGWEGAVVMLAAMTMSKLHGWNGRLPCEEFEAAIILRHVGCHSDTDLTAGIAACLRVGLIEEDGTSYVIRNWTKFQPDPTAAARKRSERARKRGHGDARDVTLRDVRTGRDEQDGTNPPEGGVELRLEGKNGKALTERQTCTVVAILDCLCKGEGTVAAQTNAIEQRKANRKGNLDYETARDLMDRWGPQFQRTIAKTLREAGL